MGEKLIDLALEEAKNANGTWTYKTIKEMQQHSRKIRDKEYNNLLNTLLESLIEAEQQALTRFKLAQMICNIRTQNTHRSQDPVNDYKKELMELIENLPFSTFSTPIKRMVLSWFNNEAKTDNALDLRRHCPMIIVKAPNPSQRISSFPKIIHF